MISLMYHSRSVLRTDDDDYFSHMALLLTQCLDANVKSGVTGVLALSNDRFLQVIEGSAEAVDATFTRIARDPRHGSVQLLSRKAIAERNLPEWSMAFVGPPVDASPLFDHIDAIGGAPVPHHAIVAELLRRVPMSRVWSVPFQFDCPNLRH